MTKVDTEMVQTALVILLFLLCSEGVSIKKIIAKLTPRFYVVGSPAKIRKGVIKYKLRQVILGSTHSFTKGSFAARGCAMWPRDQKEPLGRNWGATFE
jgi:hypothetical protein